ncbi:unnamed protein product [Psylliodes chrysocephalus]|uniref:Uncharacterized protein n=1 Tax=Psylliodes chrysocephalus TaxID=3402493 RepID=A0A9P0CUB1_9CUCU|nr:unnamed protein product [Psylliodes chrysocephala]
MSFQIDKSKLYQKLFESFKKSHTSTKVQKLVNEVWRNYKLQAKSDKEIDIIVSKRIEEELQAATKNKSNLLQFFSKDFETFLELEEFRPLAKTDHGLVKPVVIMTVDGGPDENPRYQKVIGFAIQHFKRHDLDALFLATNAPGRNAYNRVGRRMAPLSRELDGLILSHDHFGSHLDERGVTTDEHLERFNFDFAGNVLAEVWSSMEIDGYNVIAKYVGAGEQDLSDFPDIKWYSEHARAERDLDTGGLQGEKGTKKNSYCRGLLNEYFEKVSGKHKNGLVRIPEKSLCDPYTKEVIESYKKVFAIASVGIGWELVD